MTTSIKRSYFHQVSGQTGTGARIKAVELYTALRFLSEGLHTTDFLESQGRRGTGDGITKVLMEWAIYFPETGLSKTNQKHNEVQIPTDYLLTNV